MDTPAVRLTREWFSGVEQSIAKAGYPLWPEDDALQRAKLELLGEPQYVKDLSPERYEKFGKCFSRRSPNGVFHPRDM